MAHTKPELIKDLKKELAVIRKLEGIKEKSFGIFYYKAIPFLHFHHKDGKRWADVKGSRGFQKVAIGFFATATERKKFLIAVNSAHLALHKKI